MACKSFANLSSMHWGTKGRLTKKMRKAALGYCLQATTKKERTLPAKITMTRIFSGRSQVMDTDNLGRALKPVRDGIADAFEVDDGNVGWNWICDQRRGNKNCVVVEIQ